MLLSPLPGGERNGRATEQTPSERESAERVGVVGAKRPVESTGGGRNYHAGVPSNP